MMTYVLSGNGNEFECGEIEVIGESGYGMTEYIVKRLDMHFNV